MSLLPTLALRAVSRQSCRRRRRRLPRGAALLAGMAAVLVGCGGQTRTVTVTGPAPPLTGAPSAVTTTAAPVPESIAASAEKSVLPVNCFTPNAGPYFKGTGFKVASGVATASHVVAACPAGATIVFAPGNGNVAAVDSRHDAALVTYSSISSPQPLQAESARPYVGEPLALIGIPVDSQAFPLPGFGEEEATITPGIVLATHQTQQLTSADGGRETLTDAIRVTASGVASGESGGPAIDAAGKVVGVIEGASSGVATLTPVADLTSLH
jgi:trypsin-like peptidase